MNEAGLLIEEQAVCCLLNVHDNIELTRNYVHQTDVVTKQTLAVLHIQKGNTCLLAD